MGDRYQSPSYYGTEIIYVYRSGKPSLPRAALRQPSSMTSSEERGGEGGEWRREGHDLYDTMLNCMGSCSRTLEMHA